MQGKQQEEKTDKGTILTKKQQNDHFSLSMTALNINGLNSPIKTHKVPEWIKQNKTDKMLSTRNSFQF